MLIYLFLILSSLMADNNDAYVNTNKVQNYESGQGVNEEESDIDHQEHNNNENSSAQDSEKASLQPEIENGEYTAQESTAPISEYANEDINLSYIEQSEVLEEDNDLNYVYETENIKAEKISKKSKRKQKQVLSEQELYAAIKQHMRSENKYQLEDAIEKFKSHYPDSIHMEYVYVAEIFLYYIKDKYDLANAAIALFEAIYLGSPHSEYILYLKGVIAMQTTTPIYTLKLSVDWAERSSDSLNYAYNIFAHLLQKYPNSKYASDAKYRMLVIRNALAEQELNIGMYYYLRQSYPGAINRFLTVYKYYYNTPSLKQALEYLKSSYEKLKFFSVAETVADIIALNFKQEDRQENDLAVVDEDEDNNLTNNIIAN